MKAFFITLGGLCLAIVAAVIHANLQSPMPAVPAAETATAPPPSSPPSKPASLPSVSSLAVHTNDQAFALSAAHRHASNFTDPAAALAKSIDLLVSRTASFQEKQAVWKQLREAGQLDQAIDTLKQGAKDNPDSPEYAAMLGQAYLQKAGEVSKNGGSINELGILGMSADQSFDAALKIDPSNWDAQFFKAVAMSYWPAELNKSGEVVQRFSDLINQQGTLPDQPQFANTYLALGNEYQKLGQTDNALQTWQAGAAKFPNNSALQNKLTPAASPP